MPELTLRPSSNGDYNQSGVQYPASGYLYDKVYDVNDGDPTYLETNTTSTTIEAFRHNSSLPIGDILYVQVHAIVRNYGAGQPAWIKFGVKAGGNFYWSAEQQIANGALAYHEKADTWYTDPSTGNPWGWAALDPSSFQFAFAWRANYPNWKTRATSCWVTISYKDPDVHPCNVAIGDYIVI